MATTTNYGWTTPDDTGLVKDGASAIRSLGTSVDTTTKNLNPSTTLGDIEYRSSTANTNTRLGIGSSGQALTVVAGAPAWAASPTSVLTTTGDTLYASAANTLSRLGIGTAGQVLKVNSGATAPEWGSASSAFKGCSVYGTTNGNISAGSYELLAWGSENFDTDSFHSTSTNTSRITIPTGLGGKYLIQCVGRFAPATTDDRIMSLVLYVNTTEKYFSSITTTTSAPTEYYAGIGLHCILDLAAGDYLTIRAYNNDTANKPFYSSVNAGFFSATYLGA